MADIVDSATRSRMMRAIRGKDTKPEVRLRKALFAQGYRYRLHSENLPGSPDILLPRYRAAIFVHGCFWHGHDCHLFRLPTTRAEFWRQKIMGNRQRDILVQERLADEGWRVLTVWECSMKGRTRMPFDELVSRVSDWLTGTGRQLEIAGTG
ncbi:MAG: very short patch repair endonuclease [Chloroflexi bacterium]|nr:very short patch repair endonuclease [Chloroflexota bacterium]